MASNRLSTNSNTIGHTDQVCLDCGLHPQQAAVGFLGRHLGRGQHMGRVCARDLVSCFLV